MVTGQGRHEEARVLLEEDLAICRAVEPRLSHGIATSLIHLGKVLLALGLAHEAAGVFREALYICKCVLAVRQAPPLKPFSPLPPLAGELIVSACSR